MSVTWVSVVAVVIGIPLVLLAVLAIVGLFTRKGHSASRMVRYAADPDAVWNAITDWETHPKWRTRLKAVERLADRNGHEVWREIRRNGSRLTSEVTSLDPSARRMITTIVDETAFGGTWTWQVSAAPSGAGSTLSITENGEIHNPIFRAIASWFLDPRATMDQLHRDLRAKLGEPPPDFEAMD